MFKSRMIREQLDPQELADLVEDFRQYKEEGALPDTFGRDAPYDHPHTLPSVRQEDVRHLHLQDETSNWGVRTIPFYRTSDSHLVYCPGAMYDDRFLLIGILEPDGHDQARDNNVMTAIAEQAARFRDKH